MDYTTIIQSYSCLFFGWILGLLVFIFWIWMLKECLTSASFEGNDKIAWVIVILFTYLIGAALITSYASARTEQRDVSEKAILWTS